MFKVELKVDYEAHVISEIDFSVEKEFSQVPGVIYRTETRTARLMSDIEKEDSGTEVEACDFEGVKGYRRVKTPKGTAGPPGPCSYYGIGCFIIIKNGRAVDIVSPEEFREKYRPIHSSP